MEYSKLPKISLDELVFDGEDANIIGFEIMRLTRRRDLATREVIKQHRRAIPIAKRLRRLFPNKCNRIIKDLYLYNGRRQDKIGAAENGLYTIKEKEACAIGGRLGHEMTLGGDEGIKMACAIFREIPFTFIYKLIEYRENWEFEEAWQIGLDSSQDESDFTKVEIHHNKTLIFKALLRNLEFERSQKIFEKALKMIKEY